MLGDHGIFVGPAQNALADRHRVNAELAERGALQLAIGRMILDPLRVAAETVALVQHRGVAVGQPRAFVEMTAGERAEPVEMRLDVAEQRHPADECAAGPSAPDRRGRNSFPTYPARFRIGLRLLELQRAELPDFDTLDAGGGFPVAMTDDESVPSPALFAQAAQAELDAMPDGTRPARLAIEPGRAVVAGCGWLVGRVLHVRPRETPIIVLDTGMTELIRPAMYGAVHPMRALTSLGRPIGDGAPDTIQVRVDGPICKSTDTLGVTDFPPLERGDLVAIGMVGAYGSSMASTYNGRPRPPEIAWDGESLAVLRRRGSVRSLP